MLAARPSAGPQRGKTRAGDADTETVFVGDLFGGGLRRLDLHVDAHNVRALFNEAVGGLLADARAGADDDDDLARELFLGGHALQLRLFEEPVFDVECFLLREGDVGVDRLGAAHDLDGAVVELGSDAALGLVFAPGDHDQRRG